MLRGMQGRGDFLVWNPFVGPASQQGGGV